MHLKNAVFFLSRELHACLSVLPPLRVSGMELVYQAGHPMLQSVQCVVLRVMTTETVPQTAQSIPHQLQLITLTNIHANTMGKYSIFAYGQKLQTFT